MPLAPHAMASMPPRLSSSSKAKKASATRANPAIGDDHGRNGGLGQYLDDIGRYPRISREQEREFGAALRSDDPQVRLGAQEALFLANLRLVVTVAKQFGRGQFELWDLVSVGNTGLWHASGRFDERKNVPFSSYAATWIKQRIMRHIPNESTVPVPDYLGADINKILRRSTQLREVLGRAPTPDELAVDIGVPVRRVRALMHVVRPDLSFDAPVGDDNTDGATLGERLGESYAESDDRTTKMFASWDQRRLLEEALTRLPERQSQVLRWVFGFDGAGEEMDLDFVAQRLGITRERARQIKVDGLRRLATDEILALGLHAMNATAAPKE